MSCKGLLLYPYTTLSLYLEGKLTIHDDNSYLYFMFILLTCTTTHGWHLSTECYVQRNGQFNTVYTCDTYFV